MSELFIVKFGIFKDIVFVFIFVIADSWPQVFDDSDARRDWNWKPEVDLDNLVSIMIKEVKEKIKSNSH